MTGERPFAESPVMMVAEGRPLPSVLDLDMSEIPELLRPVLRACLSFEPDARPTAARLAAVLAELRTDHGRIPIHDIASRPFPLVELRELVRKSAHGRDPDAPRTREHETSPPEPHAA